MGEISEEVQRRQIERYYGNRFQPVFQGNRKPFSERNYVPLPEALWLHMVLATHRAGEKVAWGVGPLVGDTKTTHCGAYSYVWRVGGTGEPEGIAYCTKQVYKAMQRLPRQEKERIAAEAERLEAAWNAWKEGENGAGRVSRES